MFLKLPFVSLLIFFAACQTANTTAPKNAVSLAKSEPSPTVSESNTRTLAKTNPEEERERWLDERLPPQSREILENAAALEIISGGNIIGGNEKYKKYISYERWMRFGIIKTVKVYNKSQKSEILNALYTDIATEKESSMCWGPQHAIRAQYKKQKVVLVICFRCGSFRGDSTAGEIGGIISNESKAILDKVLSQHSNSE